MPNPVGVNELATGPSGVPQSRRSARAARAAGTPDQTPAVPTPSAEPAAAAESATRRCPQCAAVVARTITWCSQCYADLTPAPEPEPEPEPGPGPVAPRTALVSDDAASRAWTARVKINGAVTAHDAPVEDEPEPEPVDPEVAAQLALDAELERLSETMLAGLADPEPTGRVASLLAGGVGGGGKTALIIGGTLAVGLLGLALMAVVGVFV